MKAVNIKNVKTMKANEIIKKEKEIQIGENPKLMELVYLYLRDEAKRIKDTFENIFKWVCVKGLKANESEFNRYYNETGKGRQIICWLTKKDILKLCDVEMFKTWCRVKLPGEYSIVENIDYFTLREYMFRLYYRQKRKEETILYVLNEIEKRDRKTKVIYQ